MKLDFQTLKPVFFDSVPLVHLRLRTDRHLHVLQVVQARDRRAEWWE